MSFLRPPQFGLFLALVLIAGTPLANADVWRCGDRYTNVPAPEEECTLVKGSVVCGTGGNKYFSPNGEETDDRGPCLPSESSSSPFVNEAKINAMVAEAQANRERESAAEDRKRSNRYRPGDRARSKAATNPQIPSDLPSEQDLNCIMNEMFSGGDVDRCGVKVDDLISTLSGVTP